MKQLASMLVLSLLFALPASAAAQQTYTLKFKEMAKGDSAKMQKGETGTEKVKITDNAGNVLEEKDGKKTSSMVFTETILARPDPKKPATKLKRVYEKAETTEDGTAKTLGFQGKTILIERKDGKHTYHYEDGSNLAEDDIAALDKDFKDDETKDADFGKKLIPSETVKVGEEWKINPADVAKAFGMEDAGIDLKKAIAFGKLAKVYKKNGSDHGDIVINIVLPLKSLKTPEGDIAFEPGAAFTMEITISGCIDGTRHEMQMRIKGALKGSAKVPPDQPLAQLDVEVEMAGTWNLTEVAKK